MLHHIFQTYQNFYPFWPGKIHIRWTYSHTYFILILQSWLRSKLYGLKVLIKLKNSIVFRNKPVYIINCIHHFLNILKPYLLLIKHHKHPKICFVSTYTQLSLALLYVSIPNQYSMLIFEPIWLVLMLINNFQ